MFYNCLIIKQQNHTFHTIINKLQKIQLFEKSPIIGYYTVNKNLFSLSSQFLFIAFFFVNVQDAILLALEWYYLFSCLKTVLWGEKSH